MTDPAPLLEWMRSRPGDITARALTECAPRAYRRSADHGPAIEALIAAGTIVEVSSRPRLLRVVGAPAPQSDPGLTEPAVRRAGSDSSGPAAVPAQAASRPIWVRRPDDAEIRAAISSAYQRRRRDTTDAAALVEAASKFRAALIEQARAEAGLPCTCPTCGTAAAMVDRAIVEALR